MFQGQAPDLISDRYGREEEEREKESKKVVFKSLAETSSLLLMPLIFSALHKSHNWDGSLEKEKKIQSHLLLLCLNVQLWTPI